MSLDTLFTEAAEAGGPPRFTEDDIAARVQRRRKRRRLAVTGAAALVVLACGAVGLALAARGGEGEPPATTSAPGPVDVGIPVVPATADGLVGEWVLIEPPGGELDGPPRHLNINADGSYDNDVCNFGAGSWGVGGGVAALFEISHELGPCLTPDSWLGVVTYVDGVPTLYADGLLRFPGTVDLDFRRADAAEPDPTARRASPIGTVEMTEPALAGEWVGVNTSGTLRFDADGTVHLEDCGVADTTWAIGGEWVRDDIVRDDLVQWGDASALAEARCGAGAQAEVGWPWLTDTGVLVVPIEPEVLLFHRADATPPPAELASTRWVTFGDDLQDRSSADWIEFDDTGGFRMSVVCGTHSGTYVADGDAFALTVTDRDLGPACDPIAPPADASLATIDGDHLRVDFTATASRNLPEDLTTTYADVGSLATPTAEDLAGGWTAQYFLGGEVFYGTFQVVFDADGTARVGSCEAPASWSIDEGQLALDADDDECLRDYGLDDGSSTIDLRIDGDRLYLLPSDADTVTVLTRATDLLSRPELVLREVLDPIGIEGQTTLPVDDEEQEAAVELDWEGDTVTVHVTSLEVADPVPADVDEVVLGGRSVIGDGELAFDCGPERFAVTTAERRRLLEVGSILMDGLRCEATPPA